MDGDVTVALIPLKQTVLVHKPETTNDWGETTSLPPITLKCRADEKVEYVKNFASTTLNAEVLSSVQLLFNKLPDIRYDDVIEFTNELDVTVKRKPLLIEPIRMINGKPTLTAVYL
ncbi:hypothetical protein [Sporosarcina psychrophila]|uniref:Uncharacterized protein n=1 Tax=Sporosarcina psychrophila TaxID=1476 RepID=A0ABV2KEN3_SPOPS